MLSENYTDTAPTSWAKEIKRLILPVPQEGKWCLTYIKKRAAVEWRKIKFLPFLQKPAAVGG